MSIWASVGHGEPPIACLEAELGDYPDPHGWVDVATGFGSIRLIVVDDYGDARVAFSPTEARRLIGWLERAIEASEKPQKVFGGRWKWSKKRGDMVWKWKARKVKKVKR